MKAVFANHDTKMREWAFAKEKLMPNGVLLPNGSKLRRKDRLHAIKHSFMVLDNQIIVFASKGKHLGSGAYAHTKLAENEQGELLALKIVTHEDAFTSSLKESIIAQDLGIAGQRVTRSRKHYIAYKYLGKPLIHYSRKENLTLDQRYELCIKIALSLYALHTGEQSKANRAYCHADIHWGNLLIDEQHEPQFIDFGRSYARSNTSETKEDIVNILRMFYTPIKDRNYRQNYWIFESWIGDYDFTYSRPKRSSELETYSLDIQMIYVYLNDKDKDHNGTFPVIHYALLDLQKVYHKKVVNLSSIGLANISTKSTDDFYWSIPFASRRLLEKKILDAAEEQGYIIKKENQNKTLLNFLKEPRSYYTNPCPSALTVAETLSFCRLQLDQYVPSASERSTAQRISTVRILNSLSQPLLTFFEHISTLNNPTLETGLKGYISFQLLHSVQSTMQLPNELDALDQKDIDLIKQELVKITLEIEQLRALHEFSQNHIEQFRNLIKTIQTIESLQINFSDKKSEQAILTYSQELEARINCLLPREINDIFSSYIDKKRIEIEALATIQSLKIKEAQSVVDIILGKIKNMDVNFSDLSEIEIPHHEQLLLSQLEEISNLTPTISSTAKLDIYFAVGDKEYEISNRIRKRRIDIEKEEKKRIKAIEEHKIQAIENIIENLINAIDISFTTLKDIEEINAHSQHLTSELNKIRHTHCPDHVSFIVNFWISQKQEAINQAAENKKALVSYIDTLAFDSHLQELTQKSEKLRNKAKQNSHYCTAADKAEELCLALRNAKEQCLNKNKLDDIVKYEFKTNCLNAINKARPVLTQHREWKGALLRFMLNVLYLITFSLSDSRLGFFAKTDSEKKLDNFETGVVARISVA